MRVRGFVSIVVGLILTVGTARAQEATIIRDVLGPEGPLFVNGYLYYVEWTTGTLSRWNGKTSTVLNRHPGCSHNGLALTKRNTFLLACTDKHGAILELDMTGKELRRWNADAKGKPFYGGINDIVVALNGGAYATVFGLFEAVPTEVVGRILYLAPGARNWVEVAKDLNYANGIGISPDQKTLYVSQTVGNSILKFTINRDGSIGHRANFALLSVLVPNTSRSPWLGPDSMKIDSMGAMYVAQWCGGKILKISPEGKLLHVFPIAAGNGTTNVAFGPGGKSLYVTVVKDPNDPQAKGSIVKIPNVE